MLADVHGQFFSEAAAHAANAAGPAADAVPMPVNAGTERPQRTAPAPAAAVNGTGSVTEQPEQPRAIRCGKTTQDASPMEKQCGRPA